MYAYDKYYAHTHPPTYLPPYAHTHTFIFIFIQPGTWLWIHKHSHQRLCKITQLTLLYIRVYRWFVLARCACTRVHLIYTQYTYKYVGHIVQYIRVCELIYSRNVFYINPLISHLCTLTRSLSGEFFHVHPRSDIQHAHIPESARYMHIQYTGKIFNIKTIWGKSVRE